MDPSGVSQEHTSTLSPTNQIGSSEQSAIVPPSDGTNPNNGNLQHHNVPVTTSNGVEPIVPGRVIHDSVGPSFKDQTSSVIFSSAPANSSGSTPVVPGQVVHETFGPTFKDQAQSTATPPLFSNNSNAIQSSNVANVALSNNSNESHRISGSEPDIGPEYKDQVRISANEVASSSSNPSSSNDKLRNTAVSRSMVTMGSTGHIPIAHGVLIHEELENNFEQQQQSHQDSANMGHTVNSNQLLPKPHQSTSNQTQTTANNSNNVNDDSNLHNDIGKVSRDELTFWIKVIFGAIFLNTFLVAAIVVGIFCGIGACSSNSMSSTLSNNNENNNADTPTTRTFQPSPSPSPTIIRSDDTLVGLIPPSVGNSSTVVPTTLPSSVPTSLPSSSPESIGSSTNSDTDIPIVWFIVIGVVLDFILIYVCIYAYYRRRKKQREQLSTKKESDALEPDDNSVSRRSV